MIIISPLSSGNSLQRRNEMYIIHLSAYFPSPHSCHQLRHITLMFYAHITNTKAYTVKRAIYICANLQLEMSEQYESFIKTFPLQLTVGGGRGDGKGCV